MKEVKELKQPVIENIDRAGHARMLSHYKNKDFEISATSTQRGRNKDLFYHTCADSWGNETVQAKGMAGEADVVKLQLGNSNIKSWWIAFYTTRTDSVGNVIRDWSQFGYAVDRGGLFPFYFRYRTINNRISGQFPPVIVYSNVNVPLEYGMRIRFEIKNIESTTWWAFSRNGQEVFRADLEFEQSSGKFQACTESWGNAKFSPSVMTYYNDIFVNGQWQHIQTGIANSYSWGIQGQRQRPEFMQSQVVMGGNTPLPIDGPWLW